MNKKIIVIGVVLLMIPSIMGSFAAAQEEQVVEEVGQWISVKIIAMKFEGIDTINVTEDVFYFTIADSRGSIGKIISDLLYSRAVFYVPLNENAVEIIADENGIYALNMNLPGEYVLGFASAPIIQLPIIGKFLTPAFTESIIVVKEVGIKPGFFAGSGSDPESYQFPYWIIALCSGVLLFAISIYILKKRKEMNDNVEDGIEEEIVEEEEIISAENIAQFNPESRPITEVCSNQVNPSRQASVR